MGNLTIGSIALQLRFVDPDQVKSKKGVVGRRHEPGGKVPEAALRTIAHRPAAVGAAGPADGLSGSRCVGAGALPCEAERLTWRCVGAAAGRWGLGLRGGCPLPDDGNDDRRHRRLRCPGYRHRMDKGSGPHRVRHARL